MRQAGFFDVEERLEAISAKGDPLETIKTAAPWEDFRVDIEAVTETKLEDRKSNAGRKPYDAILKFKILVLQSLYNLSDEQTELLIRDRLSFMRFLDLGFEDAVPDATTIWLFREALVEAGLIDKLFDRFSQHLRVKGYIARGGQIVDATIVSAPKQRNSKYENEAIKAGKTPGEWEKKPAKNAQKDKDARWTKKHGQSFYGYKNHIGVDKLHKMIRKWAATDASPHDSQKLDDILDASNTGNQVWADSAYRSAEIEAKLAAQGAEEPHPSTRSAQSPALADTGSREHDALEGARACRACVRSPGELDGSQDRAHHRHGAGEVQDRDDEPRLQHAPTCTARAGGGCARLSWLRGWSSVLRRVKRPRRSMRASKRAAPPSP